MKRSVVFVFVLVLFYLAYSLFSKDTLVDLESRDISYLHTQSNFQKETPTADKTQFSVKVAKENIDKDVFDDNDYILECDTELNTLVSSENEKLYSDSNYVNRALKKENTFATKFASALAYFNKDTEASASLILELLQEQPNNKFLNYFLVAKCSEKPDTKICSEESVSNATNADFNNGAVWFQRAILEARKRDVSGVIDALDQLIAASYFNSYWAESIELFDDAFKSIGLNEERTRMITSIGYAAATSSGPVSDLFKVCQENSKLRADLAQACIDAGKRIAASSKTNLNKAFGFALQKAVFKGLNDEEKIEELNKLKDERMEYPADYLKANKLMIFDIELSRYWLEQLKLFGEQESFRLLAEEAKRLSNNPEYNPCST